jgi:1-acyl-sn-glycerol-3-phosphate acyltransferase
MIYFYVILSIALIPILENFFDILKQSYSWWLVPLLIIGFFIAMVLIHLLFVVLNFRFMSYDTDPKKGQKYYRGLVNATISLLVPLVRVNINLSGMLPEEVPTDRKMMFVCNHQHDFDPVIILSAFPDEYLAFIGKKEIFTTMPFISRAMHRLRSLPIDRENDREAAKSIIEASHILKDKKASVGLFPEGYTNKGSQLLPFRNGSFKIALKAKAPIVVCAIHNTRILPKRILRRKTVVELKIVDLIYPHEYEGMNTAELGYMIHEKMDEAYKELRKRP